MSNEAGNRISEYENEFGELWIFEYDAVKGTGVVRGLDVDWTNYPVIEGQALEVELNKKEEAWLEAAWKDATGQSESAGIYGGLETRFVSDERACWLTDDYCPICLEQKKEFDEHHCMWSSDGGTDDFFNMLRICRTCHAVLTSGSVEDRVPKDLAAFYHQVMYFGIEFFPRNNRRKRRHKDRDFLEMNPQWKARIQSFDVLSNSEKETINEEIKQSARLKYRYFRDMGLGKWSWHDHESRRT